MAQHNPPNHRAIALVTVVSLAATVPIALTDMRNAEAGSLVVAHERTAVLDALRMPGLTLVTADDPSADEARFAVDGRDDTEWVGRPGELEWKWVAAFARPVHIGLLRASLGASPTSGVPTVFHWEVRVPTRVDAICDAAPAESEDGWVALDGTDQGLPPQADLLAQPTRRSWFVDADACALRLVVDRTNAGPPVVREVQAIESARDVLLDGEAADDGTYPGFRAADAVDGTYGRRWAGAPGKSRWMLRVDLPGPVTIDRVRLVLGYDATSVPRPAWGRSYAVSWAPLHYVVEVSEDGHHWSAITGEPLRPDGSILPLRRRLVTLAQPRTVRALRLVINGATGASGLPEAGAVPVVREIAAYAADDTRPVLAAPWVLSVNANPSTETHALAGGEMMNDAYWAKFLQRRFSLVVPAMRRDDRFDRPLGPHG
ncbi:MAG TPA: discoidin domain-containing protein, partial [Polyangiaceae bacterium]